MTANPVGYSDLFGLPQYWQWTTIGAVGEGNRAIVSGPFGSNIGSRFFVQSGVPVIRGNNLTLGLTKFIDSGFVYLTEEKALEFKYCEAVANDIIVTAAGTLGQVGIIPSGAKYKRYIISNKQLRARLDAKRVDPMFAYYWLASPYMAAYIASRNTGSSVPLINLSVLKSLPLPLPPRSVQSAIVHILLSLDDKIELNRRINQTLEAIAQAIFKSWFVDFDPVRAKMEGRAPAGMDAETAALFPSEFEESAIGLIPKGWEVTTLQDAGFTALGGDWGVDQPNQKASEGALCIRGADIASLQNFTFGKMPIRYISSSSLEKRKLSDGNIALEISGGSPTQSTGRAVLISNALCQAIGKPLICSNFCRSLVPKSPTEGVYLYYLLRTLYDTDVFLSYENGTTGIKNLAFTRFMQTHLVCWPDEGTLRLFAGIIGAIHKKQITGSSESRTLAIIRDTLLPKLISGEVRIRITDDASELLDFAREQAAETVSA